MVRRIITQTLWEPGEVWFEFTDEESKAAEIINDIFCKLDTEYGVDVDRMNIRELRDLIDGIEEGQY